MKIDIKGAVYEYDAGVLVNDATLDDLTDLEDHGVSMSMLTGQESCGQAKLASAFVWLVLRQNAGEKRGYVEVRRSLRMTDIVFLPDEGDVASEAAPDPTEAGESSTRLDDDATAEPELTGSAA